MAQEKTEAKPQDQKPETEKPEAEKKPVEAPPDREAVTEGSVTVGRTKVPYRAVAGTYTMKEEDGTPKATFFYVAYTRTGVKDPAQRPITFAFNGGPGSSSVWLHMGLFGPRRVPLGDADTPPAPPAFRARSGRRTARSTTGWTRTPPRWPSSSGSGPRATGAGSRPSS